MSVDGVESLFYTSANAFCELFFVLAPIYLYEGAPWPVSTRSTPLRPKGNEGRKRKTNYIET